MFSVIFEVCPKAERFDEYLALAKRLKPLLEKVDGFVDNERFESKRRPGWIFRIRRGATKSRSSAGAPRRSTTWPRSTAARRFCGIIT